MFHYVYTPVRYVLFHGCKLIAFQNKNGDNFRPKHRFCGQLEPPTSTKILCFSEKYKKKNK